MAQKMIIAGCGPGSLEYISPLVLDAVKQAQVFVAASHLHRLFADLQAERIYIGTDCEAVLGELEKRREKRIVIGVSGDPGIASFSRLVIERFGRTSTVVIPGISAIQVACARLGLDWTGACLINAHNNQSVSIDSFSKEDIIIVLAGKGSPSMMAGFVSSTQQEHDIYVCENLTLPEEKMWKAEVEDFKKYSFPSRTIFVILKKGIM